MKQFFKKIGSAFTKNKVLEKKKNKINKPEILDQKTIEPKIKEPEVSDQKTIEPKIKEPEFSDQKTIEPKVKEPESKTKSRTSTNWLNKLGDNFKRTSSNIKKAIFSKKLDQSSLEEIEEAFLLSDLGYEHTELLISELKKKKLNYENMHTHVSNFLENQFSNIDHELVFKPQNKLRVILLFGVNGSGKTTTIAKLAKIAQNQNIKVLLAAADTFRAAAKEQIEKWADAINVAVISGDAGEDPSSVVFKAHKKAIEEHFDLLIIDTAGRLHNKIELMEELKKMTRILKKNDENAPHNKILVLDSTIGQNTYNQIDSFNQQVGITGIIMTKLDGSAKGGSLLGIVRKYNLPIHAIGVGEQADDLIPFVPKDFVSALLGKNLGEEK